MVCFLSTFHYNTHFPLLFILIICYGLRPALNPGFRWPFFHWFELIFTYEHKNLVFVVCLFVCLFIYLFICLFVYMFVNLHGINMVEKAVLNFLCFPQLSSKYDRWRHLVNNFETTVLACYFGVSCVSIWWLLKQEEMFLIFCWISIYSGNNGRWRHLVNNFDTTVSACCFGVSYVIIWWLVKQEKMV